MDKPRKSYFFLTIATLVIVFLILFLIFIPDMSATLINTVPEYPPELSAPVTNDALITSAVTVDRENVREIVAALKRPSEYYMETQSVLSYDSGSATFLRKLWVSGPVSRIDVSNAGSQNVSMRYIYTDKNMYAWAPGNRSYHTASRGEFEPDDEQMMMTFEDIINASDDDIVRAELASFEGKSCIFAEVKRQKTGYTERFWVSTSTGLLVHGETLDKSGTTVYSITSKDPQIAPQLSDTFLLPDGKIPE